MTPGMKTSEFFVVVGTLILGAVMGFYAIYKGADYLMGVAAIIGALAPHTIGYAVARTKAKADVK